MSEELAQIYDALGLGQSSAALASLALARLAAAGRSPGRAAVLAAGTGTALLVLAQAGIAAIGFESDPALLADARSNLRRLKLNSRLARAAVWQPVQALAAAGSFAGRCDLALASGLIGRLATEPQLVATLTTAAALLRPGGLLVFDLTDAALLREWEQHDRLLRDDADYLALLRTEFNEAAGTAQRRVIWFVRELETWWRGEASWQEYPWETAQLGVALERTGFGQVRLLAPADLPGQLVFLAERR